MSSKRSQAAMEFLLTYGWAIIVVLVVIGALAYFGVLDPSIILPEKCRLQTGFLSCEDHSFTVLSSGEGRLMLKLRNSFDSTITLKSIQVRRGDFECGAEYSYPYTIISGKTKTVGLSCAGVPMISSKQGFDMLIKYETGPDFEKSSPGDIYTRMALAADFSGLPVIPQQPGDGNGDGRIDDEDLIDLRSLVLGQDPAGVLDKSAYDTDGDGYMGPGDINIFGMITLLCPPDRRATAIETIKLKGVGIISSYCSNWCGDNRCMDSRDGVENLKTCPEDCAAMAVYWGDLDCNGKLDGADRSLFESAEGNEFIGCRIPSCDNGMFVQDAQTFSQNLDKFDILVSSEETPVYAYYQQQNLPEGCSGGVRIDVKSVPANCLNNPKPYLNGNYQSC